MLFDTASNTVINALSRVVPVKIWNEDLVKVHGISKETCERATELTSDLWNMIDAGTAELIVAHNAEFDHGFITPRWPQFLKLPWLCTKKDLEHKDAKSTRLGHLAVDYGIPFNNWHKAMYDAEACCRIAARYDLKQALITKNLTKFKLIVGGKYDKNYVEAIKKHNFSWDDSLKKWYKDNLTEDELKHYHKISKDISGGNWEFTIEKVPPKTY